MISLRLLNGSAKLVREFLASEQLGGVVLAACTLIALIASNSIFGEQYHAILHFDFCGLTIEEWINDGLMTIFFLLVGLELEREVYLGELRTIKKALLPVAAAIGGMIVPSGIFLMFNFGTEFQRGAGIPTATDIAFALALLSVVAKRVPLELKVFLAAVAIADDLGAVILIALFYSKNISFVYLLCAALVFAFLCVANRMRVNSIWFYLAVGVLLWFLMLRSGIHATITGVMLSFAIPFRDGGEESPSYRLQHKLHYPVALGVLPMFALANTGISIADGWFAGLFESCSLGIIFGLCIGKPIGILSATFLLVGTRLSELPTGLTLRHVFGASIAAGIGFTMSIFVTNLAFSDHALIDSCKMAILASSVLSAAVGFIWFTCFIPIVKSEPELVPE